LAPQRFLPRIAPSSRPTTSCGTVGNGDLAANVWTEQNGDLVLLASKADAWTEMNKPVKLGRIRVQHAPLCGEQARMRGNFACCIVLYRGL
jgi:hypothetical protein